MKQSGENIKTKTGLFFKGKKSTQGISHLKRRSLIQKDVLRWFHIKVVFLKHKAKSRHFFSSFGSAIGDITIILNT